MWWMLASCILSGLLGLEARRVLRGRADEAAGPRRYALYAEGLPHRALRIVEVGADSHLGWPGDAAPAGESATRPPRSFDPQRTIQSVPRRASPGLPPASQRPQAGRARPHRRHHRSRM